MNRTNFGASTNVLQMILDIEIIILSHVIATFVYGSHISTEEWIGFVVLSLIFVVIFLLANKTEYLYNVTLFYYRDRILKRMTRSFLIAVGTTVFMVGYVSNARKGLVYYTIFTCLIYALECVKIIFNKQFMKLSPRKELPRTAFLGSKESFGLFKEFLDKTTIPYIASGFIAKATEGIPEDEKDEYLGTAEELEDIIRTHNLDQIYIMQSVKENPMDFQKYIDLCVKMGVTVRMAIDFYENREAYSYVSTVGTYPIVIYHTITLNESAQFVKRIMDIVGGLVGVLLTAPIMIVTAIAIKLDSRGPICFTQTRVGKNGRNFKIYKFRSMYIDAEERKKELMEQNEIKGGVMFKMKNDPRITRVGKIIRKLSIDELPQFFNVIGGTMSLVGTRPPTIDEVEKYKTNQWRRISIKPGITGMWQVNGRSNIQDFDEIVRLDVEYIDNWSLWMDIKIMCKTVKVLLEHSDAY